LPSFGLGADHVGMTRARVAAVLGLAALELAAVGVPAAPARHVVRGHPLRRPTPADFLADPSCMVYAVRADTRIRVRAAHARTVCAALAKQLSTRAVRWSLKPQRLRHILSPICVFADPAGQVELQVVDAAVGGARGRRLCARLAGGGWLDLAGP
jgi:hypothetical protein